MPTVAEARRELAQIAERQAELQKIVDAAPKSLLTKPVPGSSNDYWELGVDCGARFAIKGLGAHNSGPLPYEGGNIFVDRDTAIQYADALDTLLMLRHQPGTEAATGDKDQVLIDTTDVQVTTDFWMGIDFKLRCISPCFATEEAAQGAIKAIGADRILRMFRTLHGVQQ